MLMFVEDPVFCLGNTEQAGLSVKALIYMERDPVRISSEMPPVLTDVFGCFPPCCRANADKVDIP
jgi:hypothetical protein